MSLLINKLKEFIKANDGKLEVSTKVLYQLISEIGLIEKGSENIQEASVKIFGGDVSEINHEKNIKFNNDKVKEIHKILNGLTCQKADFILSLAKSSLKENSTVQI